MKEVDFVKDNFATFVNQRVDRAECCLGCDVVDIMLPQRSSLVVMRIVRVVEESVHMV